MRDERAPVLIGVAQRSVRPGDAPAGDLPLEGASDPLALLEAAARAALADAGVGRDGLASLDTIGLVDVLGWTRELRTPMAGAQRDWVFRAPQPRPSS